MIYNAELVFEDDFASFKKSFIKESTRPNGDKCSVDSNSKQVSIDSSVKQQITEYTDKEFPQNDRATWP